jgi:hypothetical protein
MICRSTYTTSGTYTTFSTTLVTSIYLGTSLIDYTIFSTVY